MSWNIYWNEYSFETYLYGSEITFHQKDHVELKNALMPPSSVIKTWYSKVNYQMKRVEPSLPMIDGESQYHLSMQLETEDQGNVLVKITFYDRYENEAGFQIMRGKEMDFTCPLKTYSYTIQLIHAGSTHFHFHSMKLTEYSNEDKQIQKNTKTN